MPAVKHVVAGFRSCERIRPRRPIEHSPSRKGLLPKAEHVIFPSFSRGAAGVVGKFRHPEVEEI
jgi:hypothetical protein